MGMILLDYFVLFTMSIVLIIGVYQFYFWCQRQYFRKPRSLLTYIDQWFGYHPAWVWIYSGLYYPIIILAIFTVKDMRHFNYTAFSYFILLFMQILFFLLFPVKIPDEWRKKIKGNISEKILSFVHKFDATNNCFPSMHVSVATLTALHIFNNEPAIGIWAMAFPLLIALSALYTKQHYFLDLPPGVLLGLAAFKIFQFIYFA